MKEEKIAFKQAIEARNLILSYIEQAQNNWISHISKEELAENRDGVTLGYIALCGFYKSEERE